MVLVLSSHTSDWMVAYLECLCILYIALVFVFVRIGSWPSGQWTRVGKIGIDLLFIFFYFLLLSFDFHFRVCMPCLWPLPFHALFMTTRTFSNYRTYLFFSNNCESHQNYCVHRQFSCAAIERKCNQWAAAAAMRKYSAPINAVHTDEHFSPHRRSKLHSRMPAGTFNWIKKVLTHIWNNKENNTRRITNRNGWVARWTAEFYRTFVRGCDSHCCVLWLLHPTEWNP